MSTLVFVYGTLKQGFPNFHRNPGRRIGGVYRTRQRLPLYVAGLPDETCAPWLVHQPGQGFQVPGELYEMPDEAMPALDAFEEAGLPWGYERLRIEVEAVDDPSEVVTAWAYLKRPQQLSACPTLQGPFEAYTPALAAGYWLQGATP